MHGGAGDRRVGQRAGAGILHPVTVNGVTGDDTASDIATDVHTVAVAGGITRDSAVAAAGQVAGDIHTTAVS
ncbi:hypothetical protein NI826_28125, partial [Escherichia coli]|uniref:hypothetical protein n=1 Tax=Escherichia coli TaxID=562 RepID=UPI00209A9133